MSDMTGLGDLVREIREASANITVSDAAMAKRLDGIEDSVNELFRKTQRPGAFSADLGATDERKSAVEMCRIKHALDVPKIETTEYVPSSAQVDAAIAAKRGLKSLIRHGDMNKLDAMERKSLSAFSFGTNQFFLAPELARQAPSCLIYPTDLSGLTNRVKISAGSIKFPIDNVRMACGAWSCEASCFARRGVLALPAWAGYMDSVSTYGGAEVKHHVTA